MVVQESYLSAVVIANAVIGIVQQIPADAEVTDGKVSVNESLLTGESDEIEKAPVFGAVCLCGGACFRSLFFSMVGMVSLAIGIVNILPSKIRTGFYYSDGTCYRRIKGGGIPAKEYRDQPERLQ